MATIVHAATFTRDLDRFRQFGTRTRVDALDARGISVDKFTNEFWTSKQRAAHSLHEVSYRACFKPQLPRFFVDRLTQPGDVVYDPFMGRGTTVLEAALAGRRPVGCDINPLSKVLVGPRLRPPSEAQVARRLEKLDLSWSGKLPEDLLVFYHPDTLRELLALRGTLLSKRRLDDVDRWIRMVAVNRLTGHSRGFFSVYTLPPNQAVGVASQRRINARRKQAPEYRDVRALIVRKSRSLLRGCDDETRAALAGVRARMLTGAADQTPAIKDGLVQLVVTSPPFLDVVDYAKDNWLRCWFCGIEPGSVDITQLRSLDEWESAMTRVFRELARVLAPGGHVAFEVGEVRGGRIKLEESVLPCGVAAGLEPVLVLVNAQEFTKTANCWGVTNGKRGTNTNRIVLFRRN